MKRARRKLLFLGALTGAMVALATGISEVDCASKPVVLGVVAAGFGAGAATSAAVAEGKSERLREG